MTWTYQPGFLQKLEKRWEDSPQKIYRDLIRYDVGLMTHEVESGQDLDAIAEDLVDGVEETPWLTALVTAAGGNYHRDLMEEYDKQRSRVHETSADSPQGEEMKLYDQQDLDALEDRVRAEVEERCGYVLDGFRAVAAQTRVDVDEHPDNRWDEGRCSAWNSAAKILHSSMVRQGLIAPETRMRLRGLPGAARWVTKQTGSMTTARTPC